jgi:hypothetical protein
MFSSITNLHPVIPHLVELSVLFKTKDQYAENKSGNYLLMVPVVTESPLIQSPVGWITAHAIRVYHGLCLCYILPIDRSFKYGEYDRYLRCVPLVLQLQRLHPFTCDSYNSAVT